MGAVLNLAATINQADAQTFSDETISAGLEYVHYTSNDEFDIVQPMTGGAAAGDYDGDGWFDLFVTRPDQTDILFRNNGILNGVHQGFEDVTSQAFLTPGVIRSNGAAFGDIDNDGDADLYVTASNDTRYYLYINDGAGGFVEEAVARGASVSKPDTHYGMGVALGDYDRDGYLDVFASEWRNYPCLTNPTLAPSNTRLLRNRGSDQPGHFEDVTETAGVSIDHVAQARHGRLFEGSAFAFAPRFADMDADGHTDLLLTSDFGTSRLFWNNGDGTFTDGSVQSQIGSDRNGMGSTVGDYDGDGRLDWFVTAIDSELGNRLYHNQGDRTFSDRSVEAGVRSAGWGWGTSFLDFDNDGDQDIMMTNGFPLDRVPDDRTTLFRNDGATFTDVSLGAGITDMGQGRGMLTFDYDRDGDLDAFITNNGGQPILYRNNGNDNHWLQLTTEGTQSNRDGIGARITVIPDFDDPTTVMVREIDGGSNYLAHNELIAHFGLGKQSDAIDLITIRWPSGVVQDLRNVKPNQRINVIEPDRPLTAAESAGLVVPNAHAIASDGAAGPIVAPNMLANSTMTAVYDPRRGQLLFEGPDWHQYIEIDMRINARGENRPEFQFNTGTTTWGRRDVSSFVDEPFRQSFASFVKCNGRYAVYGGDGISNLLPPGLRFEELRDHLTVQYVMKGIPGSREASIVVIPEPSTLLLMAMGPVWIIVGTARLRSVCTQTANYQ